MGKRKGEKVKETGKRGNEKKKKIKQGKEK